MKEGIEHGTKMYLFGGGNILPMYMRTTGVETSPVFCKEVTVVSRPLSNTQHKTWISYQDNEQLVRDKVLADSWLDAYKKLSKKVGLIQPTEKVRELLEYMRRFHPEHLI